MHYNAILRSCVYLNVATCAHEYCGRAPVLCSRSALFQSKFVCDGCDRCSGSAARFVPPSRVRRFHEQLCCVVCLAALLRCHSMSLASDAESHKREESPVSLLHGAAGLARERCHSFGRHSERQLLALRRSCCSEVGFDGLSDSVCGSSVAL